MAACCDDHCFSHFQPVIAVLFCWNWFLVLFGYSFLDVCVRTSFISHQCSLLPFSLLCKPMNFPFFLSILLSFLFTKTKISIFFVFLLRSVWRPRNITNLRCHFRQIGHGVHAFQKFQHFQFGESSERDRHHTYFRRHFGPQIRSFIFIAFFMFRLCDLTNNPQYQTRPFRLHCGSVPARVPFWWSWSIWPHRENLALLNRLWFRLVVCCCCLNKKKVNTFFKNDLRWWNREHLPSQRFHALRGFYWTLWEPHLEPEWTVAGRDQRGSRSNVAHRRCRRRWKRRSF